MSNQLLDSQFKQNKKDVEKLLNNAKKIISRKNLANVREIAAVHGELSVR